MVGGDTYIPIYTNQRILPYNTTTVIVLQSSAGGYISTPNQQWDIEARAYLLNTNGFILQNIGNYTGASLFGTIHYNGDTNITQPFDTIFVYTNSVYYAYESFSDYFIYSASWYYYSGNNMLILNIASNTITMIQAYTGTTNAIATETLGGSTMYFKSATQLNTIYAITNELNETLSYYSGFYSVIKINFVTPSVTYLFSANYYYGNVWSYFIDFSYDTIGTSAYYDVLFMHSQPSTNTQFDVELLRFNDTNFVNDWQLAYFDSNMLSNKPVGCIVPNGCWGTGQLKYCW